MAKHEATPSVVDEVVASRPWCEAPADSEPPRSKVRTAIQLANSRVISIDESGGGFTVSAPGGEVELKVRITADGPILCFGAAAIEIQKAGILKLQADRLQLHAREQIEIQSHGDLSQAVAGNCTSHCEGRQNVHAGQVSVTSHRGPMTLDSTDDLAINGERVLINC